MYVISRKWLASLAASAWRRQYAISIRTKGNGEKAGIYRKLLELGDSPDPIAVDEIIGNGSWTRVPPCDECNKETDIVVELGEPPDYESRTARICPECLKAAISLLPS